MKFGTVEIPEDLYYTRTHLWVKIDAGFCRIGWTDYIQANAGDVAYIELPEKGTLLEAGQEFGSIETSKWVDKLYAPFSGRVSDVNRNLINTPELINDAPFTEGWFIEIEPAEALDTRDLMTPGVYIENLQACEV